MHSVQTAPSREQLLVVVMREQLTVPWSTRRNFGTHNFDSCLLMTFLSSLALQSANLARQGHIHEAQRLFQPVEGSSQ